MNGLVRWSVHNAPSVNTLMIAMLTIGLGSAVLLRRESFPEFSVDMVVCTVPYPGASPTEVEQGICQKIEEAIRSVDGIKKIESTAREGMGTVTAILHTHVKDTQRVVNDIRSAVDRIPSFPELAEDEVIREIVTRRPAIQVAVVGRDAHDDVAEWQLREIAERVRDELLNLPSISQVTLLADKPYQIDVEIPEQTLRKYNMTLASVAQAIRRQNVELPAGVIKAENSDVLLRGSNRGLTGREIAQLPVLTQPDGVVLNVGDLARVVDGFEDVSSYSYVDGRPALSLQVDKTPDEDLLEIADEVHRYVAQAKSQLPEGYSLVTWLDSSQEVYARVKLLTRSGLFGLILVFAVLSLFLHLRLAFWVALGIPISVLGTCAVMLYAGQTLNMLSMFSFVMALGIVVDDAIVVSENVYAHRQRGKSPIQASIDGTLEVVPAVTSSVMTTVIAFVPMFFVSGLMGKFIAVMPLAMISILLISLFESFFMLPCHLAHTTMETRGGFYHRLRGRIDTGIDFVIDHYYEPALRWLLDRPGVVFCGSASILLLTLGVIQGGFTPFVLAPDVDGDFIRCEVVFPDGTPAATTDAATKRIEDAMRQAAAEFEEQGRPVLRLIFRSVGTGMFISPIESTSGGGQAGMVWVELLPAAQRRDVTSTDIVNRWRELAGEIPGVERLTYEGADMRPGGKPIEFKIVGDNIADLEAAVEEAKRRLDSYPGVYDLADSNEAGKWEVQLKIKPEAEALGIQLADLAATVRAAYYGEEAMRLQRGRHEIKVMVRYPRTERRSLAQFEEIRVRTPQGDEIPLPELAQRDIRRSYSQITRVDQRRSIRVTSSIDDTVANAQDIAADLQTNFFPALFQQYPGIDVRWEGQQEQTNESVMSLIYGFIVALFGMYFLLTLEFRSYMQPLIILAVIPFGMVGAVMGHLVLGMPLTLFSLFGVAALAGVVANDSIVLIDFVNRHRSDGLPLQEALVAAGTSRLRPVILTSVTTIAGLVPILVERSMQAQMLIPMAVSIAAGLTVATLWILLLVPSIYQTYARYLERYAPRADDEPVAASPPGEAELVGGAAD